MCPPSSSLMKTQKNLHPKRKAKNPLLSCYFLVPVSWELTLWKHLHSQELVLDIFHCQLYFGKHLALSHLNLLENYLKGFSGRSISATEELINHTQWDVFYYLNLKRKVELHSNYVPFQKGKGKINCRKYIEISCLLPINRNTQENKISPSLA